MLPLPLTIDTLCICCHAGDLYRVVAILRSGVVYINTPGTRCHKGHPDIAKLNNLQVPQALGGNIDAIIGIRYANTYPELLFFLPNGLQIFKSRKVK